jgi:hypothetical protein
MSPRRQAVRTLSFALIAVGAGCVSHERYLISRSELVAVAEQRAAGNADESRSNSVPAVRQRDHKPVRVRKSALRYDVTRLPDTELVSIEARALNRMVTAGSVLTWIGTAISLIGTGLVAAGKLRGDDGMFVIGGALAIGAEPIMWTGTGLWIGGALRRPYEAPTWPAPPDPGSPAPVSTSAPP